MTTRDTEKPQTDQTAEKKEPPRRLCPLCGATVFEGRSKCMFCGSILGKTTVVSNTPKPRAIGTKRERTDDFAYLLLVLPVFFALFALFFVAPVHPLRSPGFKLLVTILVTGPAMAAAGILDADKLTKLGAKGLAPVYWFLRLLLAWPWFLPQYFKIRLREGRPNWKFHSLLATWIFLGSVLLSGLFIYVRKERWTPLPRPAVLRQPYHHVITGTPVPGVSVQ